MLVLSAAVTTPWDRAETAGDPAMSQQIILASAWKTAAEPDLTEREGGRGGRHNIRAQKRGTDSDSEEVTPWPETGQGGLCG